MRRAGWERHEIGVSPPAGVRDRWELATPARRLNVVRTLVPALTTAAVILVALGGGCGEDPPITNSPAAPTSEPRTASTAAAAATSAPSGTTPGAEPGRADLAAALDGRTFVATSADGYEIVSGSQIRVDFDGVRFGATGGCNSLGGSTWRIENDRLLVDSLGMTEIACEQALMDQDAWLVALLEAGPTIALDGDTLTLTTGDHGLTLRSR